MRGFIALSPLVIFVTLYLGVSLVTGDFYKMPITVAFLLASIVAVARGISHRLCLCSGGEWGYALEAAYLYV